MNHFCDGKIAGRRIARSEHRTTHGVVGLPARDCQRRQTVELGEDLQNLKPHLLLHVEFLEDCSQKRGQSILEAVLDDFQLLDELSEVWCVEALVTLSCRDKLELFRLQGAFDELLGHFKLVPVLGVAEADASVLELALNLLQEAVELLFHLIYRFVRLVKDLVDARLRLGNIPVLRAGNFFPLDEGLELVNFTLNPDRQQAVLAFLAGGHKGDQPWRSELSSAPETPHTFDRFGHILEASQENSELLHFLQRHVLEVDGFHAVLDRVSEYFGQQFLEVGQFGDPRAQNVCL